MIRAPDRKRALAMGRAEFDALLTTAALKLQKAGLFDGKEIFWSSLFECDADHTPSVVREKV